MFWIDGQKSFCLLDGLLKNGFSEGLERSKIVKPMIGMIHGAHDKFWYFLILNNFIFHKLILFEMAKHHLRKGSSPLTNTHVKIERKHTVLA